jgi:hypothetical protein
MIISVLTNRCAVGADGLHCFALEIYVTDGTGSVCTVVRKSKLLFVNGCECKSPNSTASDFCPCAKVRRSTDVLPECAEK